MALPRLHATPVDCAHELINGVSGIKGEAGKILQNSKTGSAEQEIINKRGVPSIRNSRVQNQLASFCTTKSLTEWTF